MDKLKNWKGQSNAIFKTAFHIEDPTNYPVCFFSPTIAEKVCIIALSVGGETKDIVNYLNHFIADKTYHK